MGKFGSNMEGSVKHTELRENLLVIISNKESMDFFHFIVLNP